MRSLDDYNYHNDSRVRAGERRSPFQDVDECKRTATVILEDEDGNEEPVQVHVSRVVCQTCEGDGKHVNPSVDAGGLSQEDFDEDRDFRDEYMGGMYDVTCYECQGLRVTWELDEAATGKDLVRRFRKAEREQAEFEAVSRAERMMGA